MKDLADSVYDSHGWVLYSTYGIPRACEIKTSENQGVGIYWRQIHPFCRTLMIGDGVDIPELANDDTKAAKEFSLLFNDVRQRGSAYVRHATRVLYETMFPETDFDALQARKIQKFQSTSKTHINTTIKHQNNMDMNLFQLTKD